MSLFWPCAHQALDNDGNPISGARWKFYISGTTTPRNVYSDSTLSVSLGSSIAADAEGRFPQIFLRDNLAMKGILTDGGGTSILTLDPITPTVGSGTVVTSVAFSGGTTGLTVSGSPITSSGTITLGGTLAVANGGTGSTTAAGARANLSAAASGANTDITSLQDGATITTGGTIAANSIGYRGLPASSQTQGAGITLALTDAGQTVANTTGGWTIPANASVAFPIGTTISLYNDSGSTQSLAITTDTLRWAGTTSTGTRTVAAYGMVGLRKQSSTVWVCWGNLT